jgi:ABC-2 type transport system permease protein
MNKLARTSTFLAAVTLCRREILRFLRQKSRMMGVIGSPLLFWFLIGSGLSGSFRHPDSATGMTYLEYFYPGTIVLVILFTSIFSTISIIEDRREGFLQSVLVAPISGTAIALGKILGGTILATLQGVILLLLAPVIGIPLTPASVPAVVGVIAALSFGLTGLGFLIAWKMESTQGFHAIMNLFLIPLWLLSGALFPASGASGWLGKLMLANPLTYGVGALRQILYLGSASPSVEPVPLWAGLGVMALFGVLTFAGAALLVRRGNELIA